MLHPISRTRSHLFLLNWMAKSAMTLMALLVRVISIWITPARREKVPDISRPLAFMAGSQTLIEGGRTMLFLLPPFLIWFNNMPPPNSRLTIFGGLYTPVGMPTPPPRSKRSSRPPLTGALNAGGTAAGGAPKPAPIWEPTSKILMSHQGSEA